MSIRFSRLVSFPLHVALAMALAFVLASVGLPTPRAQAQDLAVPACAEVFDLGEATQACLRVVNAGAEEVGPVDVYVGDTVVAEAVEYGQATAFTAIPSESQQLRAVPAGGTVDEAVIDFTEELQPGGAYQLVVMGLTTEELSSWLSGVDVSLLPEGQARVRAVHASPDLDAIDVAVTPDAVPFEGIELGSQSGYVPFEAGEYTFQLRQSGENTLLLETPDPIPVEEGMNYDIIVIGESEAGTLQMVVYSAEVGVAGDATPAAMLTPVSAVGGTPVAVTPGAETPAPNPEE